MNFWGKAVKWMGLFAVLFCFWGSPVSTWGSELGNQPLDNQKQLDEDFKKQQDIQEEIMGDLDLQEVEKAVDDLLEDEFSFSELIGNLMDGGQALDSEAWKKAAGKLIQEALGIQKNTCIHILLLVLLASLMSNFSMVFKSQQIGEVSFYMIYLLLFVLLLKTFGDFSEQIQAALTGIVDFMRALLPSYYLAMTAATGVTTAMVFYQMIIFIIFLAESLILKILLPGIHMYLIMNMVNYLTKEEFLSKMAELLKGAILWTLKTMVGIILGLQLIQRLISPAVDALKRTIIGKTAGAIPGVGNILNGVTEMVLGSAVLIKNCLGAAAVVILLLVGLSPLVRLGVSSLFYQFLAAIVQPVTDKRMVGCIHTMGESIGMLLRLLVTVEILFLLTVAILAGSLS